MMGMTNIFKQAQKLQVKMSELQNELANKEIETSAGGGMVKVKVNGQQEILQIKIEKEVVNPEDVEMLEDLILSALNEALKESQRMAKEEMEKLTGGIKIPGLTL